MGYNKPNPLKMMDSALKMFKAEKKGGMHRMESPMYAKEASRELKDMPIVDIEKGDAKGSPAKAYKEGASGHGYTAGQYAAHQDQSIVKQKPEHVAAHSGSPAKKQGYNDRLDESLAKDGQESSKKQSMKDRRDESKGMEKSKGKGAYSSDPGMSRKSSPANISEKAAKRKAEKGKGFVNKVYGGEDNGKAKSYTKLTRQGRKDLKETGKVSSKEIKKTVKIK